MTHPYNHPSYDPDAGRSAQQDAAKAIERSKSHTEIVTIDHTAPLERIFAEECTGSSQGNDVLEFWGCDVDGVEWRVHLRVQS